MTPEFLEPRPACNCGAPRPAAYNVKHDRECPRYEVLNPHERVIRWLWQGDWSLVDGDVKRFRQHVVWWMGMLGLIVVGNFYMITQLTIVRDLLSAIVWLGINALLGGAVATAAFQPLRIRNAYDTGKHELRMEALKYGIYFDTD